MRIKKQWISKIHFHVIIKSQDCQLVYITEKAWRNINFRMLYEQYLIFTKNFKFIALVESLINWFLLEAFWLEFKRLQLQLQSIVRTKYLNLKNLQDQISIYTIKLQSHKNKHGNIADPFIACTHDLGLDWGNSLQ